MTGDVVHGGCFFFLKKEADKGPLPNAGGQEVEKKTHPAPPAAAGPPAVTETPAVTEAPVESPVAPPAESVEPDPVNT